MHILTIVAFAAGLILGMCFRPLSIVAVAFLFIVLLFAIGSEFGLSWRLGSLLSVVAINLGYLAGALVHRRLRRSADTDTTSPEP